MAISNRDRVGRGFEVLAEGLGPFIVERLKTALPGKDWVEILKDRDGKPSKTYSGTDPYLQLRFVTQERNLFKDQLSRAEFGMAEELREVRNSWAHNEKFTNERTYRALDTMVILLTTVGAGDRADDVRAIRDEHQRLIYEEQMRKAAKAAAAMPTLSVEGLLPWREVLRPHDDVSAGRFTAAEFAADLHRVAKVSETGEPYSEDYTDPIRFFRRTYLTEGLRDLLTRAVQRVGGDLNAAPVVNLQTNFGGGKTHSMLALYHLFSGRKADEYPREVQELLSDSDRAVIQRRVHRATLVGNHIPPGDPHKKPDGTKVRTLWGELAWQLGGRAGYDLVAQSDEKSTNPGDTLRHLIIKYSPCVILIDEWVSYARQLWDRDDLPAGTFDTQFTFAQTLTEVVKGVPGALLVISIPASHAEDGRRGNGDVGSGEEVGGHNGQMALKRLQNVVRRVAEQWRPATANESFEIVRRRLFEEPDAQARTNINLIARRFGDFYRHNPGEFPKECSEPGYEDRIKAAYPIHPELFDRLYQDWSTLDRFQRTRGVLRLMSSVVHVLWQNNDASPMITPGTVPVDAPRVRDELAQYLEDTWKPIMDVDVDGQVSIPLQIDTERKTFGQRALTRRLARTVFLGSAATLHSAHKGIERQRIYLGVAMPGDTLGNFGSALHILSDRTTYLYSDGARYWYDTQASVSRTARDRAERLHIEDVYADIARRLREKETRTRGDFVGVHPAVEEHASIPDTEEARLVILHPRYTHIRSRDDSSAMVFARQALDSRGSAQRVNRNMIVFLAADANRLADVDLAVREYLAWNSIVDDAEKMKMDLRQQQIVQAKTRLKNADGAVALRIAGAYHWALVPVQPRPDRPIEWEKLKADGSEERLAVRTSQKLRQSDLIRVVHGARVIRQDLDQKLKTVWDKGHISVGELWDYCCKYPYLARLQNRSVLETGIRNVLGELSWQHEGFALATGRDDATGNYLGLAIPHEDAFGQIVDSTLLVHPQRAFEQRNREKLAQVAEGALAHGVMVTSPEPGVYEGAPAEEKTEPAPPRNVRFFGSVRVNPERYARDFTKISQEIIQHLTGGGIDLEVTVEINARKADGFPDDKVRVITENARVLKFEPGSGFEDG